MRLYMNWGYIVVIRDKGYCLMLYCTFCRIAALVLIISAKQCMQLHVFLGNGEKNKLRVGRFSHVSIKN